MGAHNFFYEIEVLGVRLTVFYEGALVIEHADSQRERASDKEMHQHFNYELFFINGEASMIYEDGTVSYKDSIVVIPPWKRHYIVADKLIDYLPMYFSIKSIEGNGAFYKKLSALLEKDIIHLSMDEDERYYISHLCRIIRETEGYEQMRYLISLLFCKIFMRVVPSDSRAGIKEREEKNYGYYINLMDHYLNNCFCENIRLEDLAREMYLSPRQVSRIIKKEYDCTFKQLVNKKRLMVASMLLKSTELTVGFIANDVGYENENYFSVCFRKEFGMSPIQYREKHKTGSP